jgi:phosphocarrier protein HPr
LIGGDDGLAAGMDEVGVEAAPKVVERYVEVVNEMGLHARPVMQCVDLAKSYRAAVWFDKDGEKVDGKSPMEMMLLEAPKGTRLHITASGGDADRLVEALVELIAGGFGEE